MTKAELKKLEELLGAFLMEENDEVLRASAAPVVEAVIEAANAAIE